MAKILSTLISRFGNPQIKSQDYVKCKFKHLLSFIVKDHHINVRAALIHVLGDLIQSIGVLVSSIVIKINPEYKLADPICTLIFAVIGMVSYEMSKITINGFRLLIKTSV